MKWFAWALVCLCACSGDSGTGSGTFSPDQLTLIGNPVINGAPPANINATGGFIFVGGDLNSTSKISLTGLQVSIQIFDGGNALMGSREEACSPATIGPEASCTFAIQTATDTTYSLSRRVEIQPLCDQGPGTSRSIPLTWQPGG